MKIDAPSLKPQAQLLHGHGKKDSGFHELLEETSHEGERPPKGRERRHGDHPAYLAASSTAAGGVTPHPAVGHPPPERGRAIPAPHVQLAALPKVGGHVVVDQKPEKEKPKPAAHAQPAPPLEQPLAKAAVEPPKPAAPAQPGAPIAPPPPATAAPEVKAALAPLPPLPIEPALAQQDSLRVLLLPHVAKVSVETAEAGRLSMRVDVRDGVAHVRATGEAAPLVDARTAELRVALAQEGLALGNFELGQQQRRPDDPERPSDASGFRRAQPAAKPATEGEKPLDGGLHIHA